jgi:16S rRNA (cytidine1402-2'-O)-methyltransferase
VLCALTVAGLPSDRFLFAGFPPAQRSARQRFFQELKDTQATLIFYESPKRVYQMLDDLAQVMGGLRYAAVCRELTKRFEEVTRGSLAELAAIFAERDVKGEIVVLVDRAAAAATDAATWEDALDRAMLTMSVKDAAAMVAEAYDLPRRDVYQVALSRGRAD